MALAIMDHEPLIATIGHALGAARDLLELDNALQAECQAALEGIAVEFGEALASVIHFMPNVDEETNQLLGALTRWLP